MELWKVAALFGAVVLAGLLREANLQFKRWKTRRSELPAAVRNMGFVTDRKVLWFERSVTILFWIAIAAIVGNAIWVIGLLREWWCYPFCQAATAAPISG